MEHVGALRGVRSRARRAAALVLARPLLALVAAALFLRACALGLLFGTQVIPHDRWYFPNDDQGHYYGFARSLAHGELAPVFPTIGYDLLLVPVAAATDFVLQAIPPVAIVQMLLALPAAWLLFRAGERLVGRRAAGIGVAVWLASPAVIAPLYLPPHDSPAAIWLGLTIAVDYPSALLACAALALAAGTREDGGIPRALALGAVCGFALLTKPSNVALLAGVVAAMLAWHRYRGAFLVALTTACLLTPQLVYNHRLFGNATSFAYSPSVARRYLPTYPTLAEGTWSPVNLVKVYGKLVLTNATGPVILLAAAAALVLTWRRFPAARWLVVGQAGAYVLLLGLYHYSIGPHFPRLFTPALPALSLAAGAALARGPAGPAPPPARRLGARAAATGLLAVAAAGAIAGWIARAPATGQRLPLSIHASASVTGRDVVVEWRPPSAPARLTYIVQRSHRRDWPASSRLRGFQWRDPPVDRSFGVREGTKLRDHPGPGMWWYRVAVAPGANAQAWPPGMLLAYSPPLPAVVASR